jgi:glycosyltransferase involved in cell wall biosynthesis
MISIGIPSYNCSATLPRTLASLECQFNQDFEVIFVDDASTENLVPIVDKARKTFNKVIYDRLPENVGAGQVRQKIVDLATRKYLMFVDSDDVLLSPQVTLLFKEIIVDAMPDIITTGFLEFPKEMSVKNAVYHDPQAIAWVHGKCYSTSFINLNNIKFPEFRFYEDGAFNLVAFELSKKIAQNETPTYGWMHNDVSVTRSQDYNVIIRPNYFTSFLRAYRILKVLRPDRAKGIPIRCLLFAYHYDQALSQRGVKEDTLAIARTIIATLIEESGVLTEIINNPDMKNIFVDMYNKAKNAVIVQEGPYTELESYYEWFERCFNKKFPPIVLR